jgi:hypothetical protein
VEPSWYPRFWLYANLDPAKLPELERLLSARLESDFEDIKSVIDKHVAKAIEVRASVAPGMLLAVGEAATYCGSMAMRWEERSEAYWALAAYFAAKLKGAGYWAFTPRTHSGPEDPSWREFPERLRQANEAFLS